jgi:hypothetical protein
MTAVVRLVLETGARILEFFGSRSVKGTGVTNALAKFSGLMARAQVLVVQQREGAVMARAASEARKELRIALQFKLLRYLTRVAKVASRDKSGLAEQLRLPAFNVSHLVFITSVKSLLTAARAQMDLLVSQGMSETLLDDLGRTVDEFEAASEASRAGRRARMDARKELDSIVFQITAQIRLLDGMVRYQFEKDGAALGAWEAVSSIPGPSRLKAPKPEAPAA